MRSATQVGTTHPPSMRVHVLGWVVRDGQRCCGAVQRMGRPAAVLPLVHLLMRLPGCAAQGPGPVRRMCVACWRPARPAGRATRPSAAPGVCGVSSSAGRPARCGAAGFLEGQGEWVPPRSILEQAHVWVLCASWRCMPSCRCVQGFSKANKGSPEEKARKNVLVRPGAGSFALPRGTCPLPFKGVPPLLHVCRWCCS